MPWHQGPGIKALARTGKHQHPGIASPRNRTARAQPRLGGDSKQGTSKVFDQRDGPSTGSSDACAEGSTARLPFTFNGFVSSSDRRDRSATNRPESAHPYRPILVAPHGSSTCVDILYPCGSSNRVDRQTVWIVKLYGSPKSLKGAFPSRTYAPADVSTGISGRSFIRAGSLL
jgi:hypothetical protein